MTTNETYFFRDPAHYDAIRTVLLPRLIRETARYQETAILVRGSPRLGRKPTASPCCCSKRALATGTSRFSAPIFHRKVVERARAGKYQQIEVNRGSAGGASDEVFPPYRHRSGSWAMRCAAWSVLRPSTCAEVCARMGPFDLVFCRNVMIYFDAETKKKMLKELHGTLFARRMAVAGRH